MFRVCVPDLCFAFQVYVMCSRFVFCVPVDVPCLCFVFQICFFLYSVPVCVRVLCSRFVFCVPVCVSGLCFVF